MQTYWSNWHSWQCSPCQARKSVLKPSHDWCCVCSWLVENTLFFQVDTSSLQAEEVWTGVTYAVAASMIQEVLYIASPEVSLFYSIVIVRTWIIHDTISTIVAWWLVYILRYVLVKRERRGSYLLSWRNMYLFTLFPTGMTGGDEVSPNSCLYAIFLL